MAALLEPFGLTAGQFAILNHLARADQMGKAAERISDIAAAVQVGQPAVTKAVVKFETAHLVSLSEDRGDRRVRRVKIAPAGHRLLENVRAAIGPDLANAYACLGADDLVQLTLLLKRLGRWLDQNRL